MSEFYLKYRPKLFKQVVGQDAAVASLQKLLKNKERFPHALLFTGPSGCGKTTLARILQHKLSCGDSDFFEVNCADFNGINTVRDIRSRMKLSPMNGLCRIWLIDEAHQLTGDAQDALLKMLEDTPSHVYFMLATTNPGKLKETVVNRCNEVRVKALPPKHMEQLLQEVCQKEKIKILETVRDAIVEAAAGSARKALVFLNQVSLLETEDEQLEVVHAGGSKKPMIDLARAMLNPQSKWAVIANLLRIIDDEPEQIRRMLLGYMSSVVLGGGKLAARAYFIGQVMRDHFYDCGRPGLILSCYEIYSNKK